MLFRHAVCKGINPDMRVQKMNLTAVTERGAMMDRHIADSLSLLPIIEGAHAAYCKSSAGESIKVVDIGSGAGLPGIVLAIARPGELLIPMDMQSWHYV